MPRFEPKLLARFPWATFGRAELPGEFFQKIEEQETRAALFPDAVRFSLVSTVDHLEGLEQAARTWESLLLQSYPRWEVWVAAEGKLREQLALPNDPRFHFLPILPGTSCAEAKNLALAQATGDWAGVVSAGDVLSPSALYQLAWEIGREPSAEAFYTHEVGLRANGELGNFFSKCRWSAWTLAHWNYVGRFWIAKRTPDLFFEEAGGAEEQLALWRCGQRGGVGLVPQFLYYGLRSGTWNEPSPLAQRAIEKALQEHDRHLTLERVAVSGRDRLRLVPGGRTPRVSAVICFRDRAEMTLRALRSLLNLRGGVELDVVLVDNESSAEQRAQIEALLPTWPVPVKLVSFPGAFNYNRMHNWAVREHTTADLVLLLNNDVELKEGSLEYWARVAAVPNVASTGILLRFTHGGVQHAGIRAWFGGEARVARIGNAHFDDAMTFESREVFANTFAACLVQRAALDAVGGLRERDLVNGFGDVAFCFEAKRLGWRHVYLGSVMGIHQEGSSRGKQPYEYWEECGIEREYPSLLQRMLREDLGFNRVPSADYAVFPFLVQALKVYFRRHSRWLDPVKPWIKKQLIRVTPARDSA